MNNYHKRIQNIINRPLFKNPMVIYQTKEMLFDNILERLKHSTTNLVSVKEKKLIELKSSYLFKNPKKILDNKKNKYTNIISKLETLSPLLTLKRGYTITKKDNKVINSSKDVKKKDKIDIEFNDGTISAEVLWKMMI